MRSHVFLTPMTPDGKPGEVRELIFNDQAPREFIAPVSPWAVNEKQLGDLRTAVTEAETALRHAKSRRASSAEIKRLEKAVTSAKHELNIVEYELRLKRQREQTGTPTALARQTSAQPVAAAVASVNAVVRKVSSPCRREGPTVRAYAAHGKRAYEVKGMFGTAIMVR